MPITKHTYPIIQFKLAIDGQKCWNSDFQGRNLTVDCALCLIDADSWVSIFKLKVHALARDLYNDLKLV